MIQLEGPGWRLAWRDENHRFAVLIGGQGWAVELSAAEAKALAAAVADLVCEHQALFDQLLSEEAITLEVSWSVEASSGLCQALQRLGGQP